MKPPAIVLVRPRYGGNIGSVCRIIRNFALGPLVLIDPEASPSDDEARKMAYGALDVLEAARLSKALSDIAADYDMMVGTSARQGKDRRQPTSPRRLVEQVLPGYDLTEWALVFGPEEAGLTTDELELCQVTVEIPTVAPQRSMNLSHAVAVLGYEVREASRRTVGPTPRLGEKARRALDEALPQMERFLQDVGYPTRTSRERCMADIRRLLFSAHVQERDVKTLLGLLRHLRYRLQEPPETETNE